MAQVSRQTGPFLFLAEGVFMYLEYEDVRSLVLAIRQQFPGSELVCEVENSFWLGPLTKRILAYKLQKQCNLGAGAVFRSGIRDSREMEAWGDGIRFLDEWSYFDSDEKKLGLLRLLRHIGWIRKTQWTVHYRLG
jgi:O-methyltransferase involved in polyketide biosynthesis